MARRDRRVVGYADKPDKASRLQDAGAHAIATEMHHLADAIRAALTSRAKAAATKDTREPCVRST
jgi:hypothetical protein